MAYRVIQWSTGNVGRYALRGIIGHPELELAGLVVHNPEKAGLDAGELCGLDPVGMLATTDADELLASDADCVSYTATGDLRPVEAIDDICKILRAGKNVVSTSLVPLVYPPHAPAEMRAPIEQACEEGKASFFTSGIDPGFANDMLPLVLAQVCERVDQIRIQEVLNYGTYDQPEVLFGTMGFGQALDATPILLMPGVLTLAWGGVIKMIADGLGFELDDILESHERRPAIGAVDVCSSIVEAGTTAGLRFELQGIVGGKPRVIVEHVTRLQDEIAPEWAPMPGKGGYRILISGSPNVTCELMLEGDGGDENSGGLIVTAMRILNAIPFVCEAPPGMLSALDIPLVRAPLAR